MKISVVTPVYNGEKYIRETIESIKGQSYNNYEHIIIDALSTDNTINIIKEYPHVLYLSEKDHGQSDAINKGFRLAKGDILAWQNADDLYFPNTFDTIVEFFNNHSEVDIVYGYYQLIDQDRKWICDVYPIKWSGWLFSHGRFCPPQPTIFWRRRVYEKVGLLNDSLNYCMDVDFYSRAVKNNFVFERIPKMIGQFRIHVDSKTQNRDNEKKVFEEYKKVLADNFNYNLFDIFLYKMFQARAKVTKVVKQKWLKKI